MVNVQKDACFGLSWPICMIFKVFIQFSEIAIFEKIVKIPFLQICISFFFFFFLLFFIVVHLAVHTHTLKLLKIC